MQGRSKTTTGYMDGISDQEKKNTLQTYTSPHICKTDRSRFLGYQQSLFLMALLIGYKTVEDAFDCPVTETKLKRLVSGF